MFMNLTKILACCSVLAFISTQAEAMNVDQNLAREASSKDSASAVIKAGVDLTEDELKQEIKEKDEEIASLDKTINHMRSDLSLIVNEKSTRENIAYKDLKKAKKEFEIDIKAAEKKLAREERAFLEWQLNKILAAKAGVPVGAIQEGLFIRPDLVHSLGRFQEFRKD